MATAGDVIQRALQRILVQASDAPLEPDEYADALNDLNSMMDAWSADGLELGYTTVDNVSDEVTVPNGALRGIIANLALEVSPDYGGVVTQTLVRQAQDAMKVIEKIGVNIPQTAYPPTLPLGSGTEDTPDLYSHFYQLPGSALVALQANTRATTISASATPVLVDGFWEVIRSKGMTADINGRITNSTTLTTDAEVKVTLTATAAAGAYTFHLMENGVSRKTQAATLSTTASSVTFNTLVTLEPGNYLEIWVADDAATNNVTVVDAQVEVS